MVMEIVFVVVGVIAIISLYDYFTTKNWQQPTSSARNEVVFKNRNKEYGAFALRRDYDKTLLFVIAGVTSLIGLTSFTLMSGKHTAKEVVVNPPVDTYDTTILIFDQKQDDVVSQKHKTETADNSQNNHADNSLFQFSDDTTATKNMASQDEKPGTKTPGNPGDEVWEEPGNGTGTGTGTRKEPEPEKPVIHDDHEVDDDARFNGSLQHYIAKNFVVPQGDFDDQVEGTCYLKFVINEDGNISNVVVEKGVPYCSSCDREAIRVVKNMPNWIPAKIKGKAVRCYARLPIKISFN